LRLAPQVGRLIATDVSAGMIAIARDKAVAQGVTTVDFRVADAGAALSGEGPFDVVMAFNLLHLVTDRTVVLRQVAASLRPGGLFITKTPCLAEMNPFIRLALPLMRVTGLAPPVAVFDAGTLAHEMAAQGFVVRERARHGSGRKDARIYLVAARPHLPLAIPAVAAAGIGA
jgi:ubiquinone/menaquinone biosynthesis C-methylase UbiE